jgi:unsaturated chondroitin disaccharide hydrolase
MTPTWNRPIESILRRIDATAEQVTEGFPHYADTDSGEWTTSPAGDWTGGFWNGMLWVALHRTGDARYEKWAEQWTDWLRPRATSETIFRGFLFYYGAAIGYLLTGNKAARDIAIEGARGLATLYNPQARAIPLGSEAEEASDVGRGEANVDGVLGTSLLVWAARESGDEDLYDIGINHSLRHIEFCVRDDNSVCQSASFDVDSGEMLKRYTHKGFTDDSTWTRAQAWAMIGYSVNAAWVPDQPEFLETAMRTADWWIDNVPEDRVAYWDFDAPQSSESKRDTSGTAIAAAALLKLADLAPEESDRQRYRTSGEATVDALASGYLTPVGAEDERPEGILTQGCYNHRIGLATSNELIWGSYYHFEALNILDGSLEATQI